MTTITAAIPTKGRPEFLRDTLASIAAAEPAPDEVLVVDGDAERSAEPVARDAGARYVTSSAGLTRQRNVALREATGEVVAFFDDDVRVHPGVFAALDRAYADRAVVGATGRLVEDGSRRLGGMRSSVRRLLFGGGREGTFTRFGYPRYLLGLDTERDVEIMPGCFMSARRDVAERVGFDERLAGYGLAEDEDFAYRLSRAGRIVYLPDAIVEHLRLGFGSADPRAFGRMVVENRAYLFRKNFPQTMLARAQFAVFVLVLIAHRVVNREWQGALGLVEGAAHVWRRR